MISASKALVFLVFVSFSALVAAEAETAARKSIRIGNAAEPSDLDPHLSGGVPEDNILVNLVEGLVGKDPKTLQPIPATAEKWDEIEAGKKYVFHLRANAKWSNGEPVTAHDFVYAWKRLLTPATASQHAFYAFYFKGGKAFHEGAAGAEMKLGFRALNKNTLEVELENTTPFFLTLLEHPSLAPLHQKTLETHRAQWTRPGNFVGNGAFILKSWNLNEAVVLAKNPNYWDAANVALEEASYLPIEDAFTEEKLYRSGQLDVTAQVPMELISKWRGKSEFVSHPYLGTYFLVLNFRDAEVKNKALREALTLSIHRTLLAKKVLGQAYTPATSLVPPGTGGYEIPKVWELNPNAPLAKAKLKAAKELLKNPKLDLLFNSGSLHQKIAEAVQQMWKKEMGLKVELSNREWKVYLDSMKQGAFRIARRGWVGNYNDPVTFLELFMSGNPQNVSGYSNPKYDEAVTKGSHVSDKAERGKLFAEAEKILRDDVAFIPLYFYRRNYLKSSKILGWSPNIEDKHPLKYVSIAP